jgi:hypothetical protein
MPQLIGLPTLMWHLMHRKVQGEHVDPVSTCVPPSKPLPIRSELIPRNHSFVLQLENARATMDLYRSAEEELERSVKAGEWQFFLPPGNFARCYL